MAERVLQFAKQLKLVPCPPTCCASFFTSGPQLNFHAVFQKYHSAKSFVTACGCFNAKGQNRAGHLEDVQMVWAVSTFDMSFNSVSFLWTILQSQMSQLWKVSLAKWAERLLDTQKTRKMVSADVNVYTHETMKACSVTARFWNLCKWLDEILETGSSAWTRSQASEWSQDKPGFSVW